MPERSKYWKKWWVSTHWPMTHVTHRIMATHVTHWPMTHRPIAYPGFVTRQNHPRRASSSQVRYKNKKLSCRRKAAQLYLLLKPWNVAYGSLKIVENGSIPKLGYGFLIAFYSNTALSVAVSTQYTNVTDIQPDMHRTTARVSRAMQPR